MAEGAGQELPRRRAAGTDASGNARLRRHPALPAAADHRRLRRARPGAQPQATRPELRDPQRARPTRTTASTASGSPTPPCTPRWPAGRRWSSAAGTAASSHIPIRVAISRRSTSSTPNGDLWLSVLESTGQPARWGRRPADACYQVVMLPPVFAYLDPGTGSMLVQLLVGGLAALAVAVKLYWYRILRVLRIRKPEPEPNRHRSPERRARLLPRPRESRVHLAGRRLPRAERDRAGGLGGARGSPLWRELRTRAASSRPSRRRSTACPTCSPARPRACCATSACRSSPTRTSGRSRCSRTPRCCSSSSTGARCGADLALKDASPYNVQWRGTRPVFIDVGSFERLRAGRAVGRLPAVLHAVPLSADAAGLQGPAVPRGAARLARRDPAARRARACSPASASARA